MVRFPTAARAPKRPPADPLRHGRLLLRRLLDENLALRRELDDLRLLRRLAHQDALTGLPNRRLFEQRLDDELTRAVRAGGACGTLLVVDVNDLKVVNDRHGHAVGDDVLREVADVIRGALREWDVCCRTGGDEFMILLPGTDAQGAPHVMARLRAAVMRAGSRRNLPISISVGRATWPAEGGTAAALIERADQGMCAEKRRLGGRARRKPPAPGAARKLALVRP